MAPYAAMSERSTEPRQYAVSFVLPAYNEESNIVEVLSSAIAAGERYCRSFEVIVVDDGSVDRTAQLVRGVAAQRNHVQLVCHDRNEGYGMALRTGFANAGFDLIFFTDADGQFDFDDLRLLLAWIPHADVVVGYRSTRRDAAQRRLNAWAWNRIMRWLFYVPVRDIDCAFKLFRRSALTGVDLFSTGAMVNTELIVKLARASRTFVEVPVTHRPRTAGAPHGAKLRVILRALSELARQYSALATLTPGPPPGADVIIGGSEGVFTTSARPPALHAS